jgi:hypothetical protein
MEHGSLMEVVMKKYLLLVFALMAVSCNDGSTDPEDGVSEDKLNFLRFNSATAVTTREASFYAVKGQTRKIEINYADGQRFMRFDVNSNSLLSAPDGRVYQNGDSVLITVKLGTSNRIVVEFEPSGLKFNPVSPAELEINFEKKNADIDGDGDNDSRDRNLHLKAKVWKQEKPGRPWIPQPTFRIDENDAKAQILSFTGFAMAS